MADVGEQFCLSLDFTSEKLGPDVLWFNPPAKYQLRCNGSSGVKIFSVSCTEWSCRCCDRYSMLPSIRTVPVPGHLKQKLNF